MRISHPSIHIAPPSSPKIPDYCNPARRIQLKLHNKPKVHKETDDKFESDDGSDSYLFNQMSSDSYESGPEGFDRDSENYGLPTPKVHLPSSVPQKPSSFSYLSSSPNLISTLSPPSSPTRHSYNGDEHVFHNELETFRNKNDKNDTIDIDKESDDISLFLKAGLNPPTPMIKPPTRDSPIKSFLRLLIPAKLFHVTQLKQKENKKLPLVKVPSKLPPFSTDQIETCYLIADFVNDLNTETDLSQFFYEMYLDVIEYAFQQEDPILDLLEFPFEIVQDEYELNEEEQVKCVLSLADDILYLQLRNILSF